MKWLGNAEIVARIMLGMLTGAFVFGAWSATLEYRVQDIPKVQSDVDQVKNEYRADQKLIIDFMGRVDERLKNIERKR